MPATTIITGGAALAPTSVTASGAGTALSLTAASSTEVALGVTRGISAFGSLSVTSLTSTGVLTVNSRVNFTGGMEVPYANVSNAQGAGYVGLDAGAMLASSMEVREGGVDVRFGYAYIEGGISIGRDHGAAYVGKLRVTGLTLSGMAYPSSYGFVYAGSAGLLVRNTPPV